MNEVEIKELINKGESHHLEFKREDENNRDFAKTIIAPDFRIFLVKKTFLIGEF